MRFTDLGVANDSAILVRPTRSRSAAKPPVVRQRVEVVSDRPPRGRIGLPCSLTISDGPMRSRCEF